MSTVGEKPKKKGRQVGAKDKSPRKVACTLLSEDLIDQFCALVAKGNFRFFACTKLRVSRYTFNEWIAKGNKHLKEIMEGKRDPNDVSLFALLVQELERAEAEAHDNILSNVLESKDVKAQQWFLERRYPKLYRAYPQRRLDDEEMAEEDVDAVALLSDKLKQLMEKE